MNAGREPPRSIALFLLHTVLFPEGLLPLRVFEQRYMQMTTACLRDDEPFGVCLISEGGEVGAPALPYPVGCLARIVQWDMQQLGLLHITARGERRFLIRERRLQDDGLARAEIELLAPEDDAPVPEEFRLCAELLKAIIEEGGSAQIAAPFRFDSASWVSGRLTELLPLPLAFKQQLLEMNASSERLASLQRVLREQNLAPPG